MLSRDVFATLDAFSHQDCKPLCSDPVWKDLKCIGRKEGRIRNIIEKVENKYEGNSG